MRGLGIRYSTLKPGNCEASVGLPLQNDPLLNRTHARFMKGTKKIKRKSKLSGHILAR